MADHERFLKYFRMSPNLLENFLRLTAPRILKCTCSSNVQTKSLPQSIFEVSADLPFAIFDGSFRMIC